MLLIIPILIFVLLIFGYIFYAYNRMTQLRNVAETEWAQIDVLLKKRYDLIPNIIETVKGYAKHEMSVMESVSKSRTEASLLKKSGTNAENSLSSHVKSILALREAYPDLKASQDFLALERELFSIEDEIADRRKNYNDIVKAHNDFILKFPANVVASMTGFSMLDVFEFTGSRDAPDISFNQL